MIDFHSHILPGIDDGSPDVATSVRMVQAMRLQGIYTAVATSHFYASQRTPSHFLERRAEAWEALEPSLPPDAPEILLGAEVLYYPGISRMEELSSLCIEGTDILLLEMPFHPWSEPTIQEVTELASSGEFTIVLAHIERYFDQNPRRVWDTFLDYGILMQSNASFFNSLLTRRKALRLLQEDRIHLLGTDAHNMSSRAPDMDKAVSIIRKHLGDEILSYIDHLSRHLLSGDL